MDITPHHRPIPVAAADGTVHVVTSCWIFSFFESWPAMVGWAFMGGLWAGQLLAMPNDSPSMVFVVAFFISYMLLSPHTYQGRVVGDQLVLDGRSLMRPVTFRIVRENAAGYVVRRRWWPINVHLGRAHAPAG